MPAIQRFIRFARARRDDFVYDFVLAILLSAFGYLMLKMTQLFATAEAQSWLVPTICIVIMLGIVIFPIVRELKRPKAIVQIQAGASVGRMIFPVDPVKAAKGKYFENQSLNISSLITDGFIIGKTCKNCEIHGPAVLALDPKSYLAGEMHCSRNADAKLVVPDAAHPPAGIVGVLDSKFEGCRFYDIGVVDHTRRAVIVEKADS